MATAAALAQLGYDLGSTVRVFSIPEGAPAEGVLETDDVILSANGVPITVVDDLRTQIQARDGAAVALTVERDGAEKDLEIQPVYSEADEVWQIGISTIHDYDFPFDVTIQLDNVGGPSAGQMFALGIIDTLTDGDLTGGEHIEATLEGGAVEHVALRQPTSRARRPPGGPGAVRDVEAVVRRQVDLDQLGRALLGGVPVYVAAQEGAFMGGAVGEVHGAKLVGLLRKAVADKVAAVVLLVVTKVRDGGGPTPWNLFGAGLICFSIGCLARTALASSEGPKP